LRGIFTVAMPVRAIRSPLPYSFIVSNTLSVAGWARASRFWIVSPRSRAAPASSTFFPSMRPFQNRVSNAGFAPDALMPDQGSCRVANLSPPPSLRNAEIGSSKLPAGASCGPLRAARLARLASSPRAGRAACEAGGRGSRAFASRIQNPKLGSLSSFEKVSLLGTGASAIRRMCLGTGRGVFCARMASLQRAVERTDQQLPGRSGDQSDRGGQPALTEGLRDLPAALRESGGASTGSPASRHSGYPSSSLRTAKPRLRSSATASNASTQYGPRQ